MNIRILYIVFIVVFVFTSCVPRKDLIYLQDKGYTAEKIVTPLPNKPYRLQTNDVLNVDIKALDASLVNIFKVSETDISSETGLYFKGYTIDDHGNIRMPILGEVNVLGFTTDEVRLKIEQLLLEGYFKKEAGIFVNVKLAGFRYTINGEVGLTGTKTLYVEKLSILEAVANSGDITITGDRKDVKVIRQFPQGTQTYSIDLTDSNAIQSPVYFLQPNDYIYIKPLKQKTWGTGKTGIESLGTIITLLSLATTTYLLLTN